jgi:pimeloyl-ACP methyl ester carboxylesterase
VSVPELKREVDRICAYLNRFPRQDRIKVLREELEKLPDDARELALTLVATTIDISEDPAAQANFAVKRRLVILVHGIRTRAEWQGRIRQLFEADGQTDVETLGYGYFDVFRFVFPFFTRRGPIEEIERNIRDALKLYPKRDEVVFVGHSFGSYILGTILSEQPDIDVDRVLLCGSILSRKFRWDKLPNRPKAVLNEVGSRDIWPILAHSITWGYGSTGTFGFKTAGVRDRYHDCAHSDYFNPGFAEEFWVPWIHLGIRKASPFETAAQTPTPFFKNLLEVVPLKYLILSLIVVAAWLLLAAKWGNLSAAIDITPLSAGRHIQSLGSNFDAAYEITFWNSVSAQNHPDELKAYLNEFPEGKFSALAVIRLKNLKPSAMTWDDQKADTIAFIRRYFERIGVEVGIVLDDQRRQIVFSTKRSYAALMPEEGVWELLEGKLLFGRGTCIYGLEMFYSRAPKSSPPSLARFLRWTDDSNPGWKHFNDSFGRRLGEQLSVEVNGMKARE